MECVVVCGVCERGLVNSDAQQLAMDGTPLQMNISQDVKATSQDVKAAM